MDPYAFLLDDEPRPLGEAAPAIYQTSLFAFDTVEELEKAMETHAAPYYSRVDNPTVRQFEEKIARLEHTEDALAFASGMGAIAAALLALLRPGDRVVAAGPVYAGAYHLLKRLRTWGIETTLLDAQDLEGIQAALPGAKLLYLEAPTSYTFAVPPVLRLAEAARATGALSLIDATYTAGILANPREQGVDLVLHSASKFFSGHSDTVAGVVAGDRTLLDRIRPYRTLLGAKLGPFEAWLLIRGLRTLPLRLARHGETASRLADYLERHPAVRGVFFPRPGKYLRAPGSLFGVELEDEKAARAFANALKRFKKGVSWGGHESLALPLAAQPRVREAYGFPGGLVRLHAGLEDAGALLEDLEHALQILS